MVELNIKLPDGFLNEEVRCGYTVSVEKKEIWAVELDLLNEFQRVAKKYDLKYIAEGGTMLGAVRHKGFIPWDDDIDIMMMRSEYERLCEIANTEFSSPYFFQTEKTDPGSLRCHAQLRNSNTTAILKSELKGNFSFNQGIFIDIFPLDSVPDEESIFDKTSKEAMRYYRLMQFCSSVSWHYINDFSTFKGIFKAVLHYVGNYPLSIITNYYYNKYEKICKRFNDVPTKKLSIYCWGYRYKKLHRLRENHLETIVVDFEFLKVPICKNFDCALSEVFGDWRKFVIGTSVHGEVLFDTNNPYTSYISRD